MNSARSRLRAFPGSLAVAAAAALILVPSTARAQRLLLSTGHPWGGSLVGVRVEYAEAAADSIVGITGTLAGEPLHFRRQQDEASSFGAVPVTASDSVVASVELLHASGRVDSLRRVLPFPHQAAPAAEAPAGRRVRVRRARRLRVDRRFTARPDSATTARVERENELARRIGREAHDVPQLWTEPFMRPRSARVTSRFGSGRVFNGRLRSSHLGLDFAGHLGEPVYAANRGVVALVDTFFLAGTVIYIDHGAGVSTGYFHLSRPLVSVGDTVERGEEIGLVGATGRVTGPHLHWAARYGATVFDPAEILRVTSPAEYARVEQRGRVRRVAHHARRKGHAVTKTAHATRGAKSASSGG